MLAPWSALDESHCATCVCLSLWLSLQGYNIVRVFNTSQTAATSWQLRDVRHSSVWCVVFAFCIGLVFLYYAQYCEPTVLQFVRVLHRKSYLSRTLCNSHSTWALMQSHRHRRHALALFVSICARARVHASARATGTDTELR